MSECMRGKEIVIAGLLCLLLSLAPALASQSLNFTTAPDEEDYFDLLVRIIDWAPYELIERIYEETSHLAYVHEGRSLFSIAAERREDARVSALLMRHRPSVDDPDPLGFTPLMYAALKERTETVKLLLSSGADVNYRSKDGFTALHFAAAKNTGPEIFRLLLKAGADPRIKTSFGLGVHDAVMRNPALKDSVLAEELYWKEPAQ